MQHPWNHRLHAVAGALRLSPRDIARAVQLGGGEATASMARAWRASPESTKVGVHGQTLRKFRAMTESEFDAFLRGLQRVLDELDSEQ